MKATRITISGLMAVVAAFGFASLGVRQFRAAYVEGLPENYAGDGNSQDLLVLGEAIPALLCMSLAGAICGLVARRSRFAASIHRAGRPISWASVPLLLVTLLLPLHTFAKQAAWGATFFAITLFRISNRVSTIDVIGALAGSGRRLSLTGRTRANP